MEELGWDGKQLPSDCRLSLFTGSPLDDPYVIADELLPLAQMVWRDLHGSDVADDVDAGDVEDPAWLRERRERLERAATCGVDALRRNTTRDRTETAVDRDAAVLVAAKLLGLSWKEAWTAIGKRAQGGHAEDVRARAEQLRIRLPAVVVVDDSGDEIERRYGECGEFVRTVLDASAGLRQAVAAKEVWWRDIYSRHVAEAAQIGNAETVALAELAQEQHDVARRQRSGRPAKADKAAFDRQYELRLETAAGRLRELANRQS